MANRIRFCVLCSLLCLGVGASAAKLGDKEIGELVSEFCAPAATAERRADIVKSLRAVKDKPLSKAVGNALKSNATKSGALDLIRTLRLEGFFQEAKALLGTEHTEKAVHAIFLAREKGAEEFLVEQWTKGTEDSDLYRQVTAGFKTHFVGAKALDKLHELLVKPGPSEGKSADLVAILRFQMVLSESEAAGLRDNWRSLLATFHVRSREFPAQHRSLLAEGGWTPTEEEWSDGGVTRFREKILLEPAGRYELFKVAWRNFTLRTWVLVIDGENASIGMVLKGNAKLGASLQSGMWVTNKSVQMDVSPATLGQWTEMVFKLSGAEASVVVDGTTLATTREYGDLCGGVSFAAGSGHVLIGSADLELTR